jgi:hypothetical protein
MISRRPISEEAKLASARASSQRTNNMLRRLIRIVGDDAGTYTVAEVAQRVGYPPAITSNAISRARICGHLTWEAIRRTAERVSQHANMQTRKGAA